MEKTIHVREKFQLLCASKMICVMVVNAWKVMDTALMEFANVSQLREVHKPVKIQQFLMKGCWKLNMVRIANVEPTSQLWNILYGFLQYNSLGVN